MKAFLSRFFDSFFRFGVPLCWLIVCLHNCLSDEFSSYFWSCTMTSEIEFGMLINNVFFCVMYLASQLVNLFIDLISSFIKRKSSAEADKTN